MIINDKLEVFEDFRSDTDLPKFWKNHKRGGGRFELENRDQEQVQMTVMQLVSPSTATTNLMTNVGSGMMVQPRWALGNGQNVRMSGGTFRRFEGLILPSPWQRFLLWFGIEPKPRERAPLITIEEFFKSMKNSVEELDVLEERAAGYKAALQKAIDGGQQALIDELSKAIEGVRGEAQLFAMNHKKFLEEKTVVDFVKKSPKGLRLDWVANFTRVIPADLLKLKLELDEKDVFDNYVVMHYDPLAKAYALTPAEKERKKDPILFGVMVGRRRLYYVGDWVDEYCDLTLDKIAESLGKEVIKTLE